jgi:hypothetical protein
MRRQAWWATFALVLVPAPAQAQVIRAAVCMTMAT